MPSFESCDPASMARDNLLSGPLEALRDGARMAEGAEAASPEALRRLGRDFASVFYATLYRQMQKTVERDEDEGPLAEGARDFMAVFLPRALADMEADPLARQIFAGLKAQHGDRADERV